MLPLWVTFNKVAHFDLFQFYPTFCLCLFESFECKEIIFLGKNMYFYGENISIEFESNSVLFNAKFRHRWGVKLEWSVYVCITEVIFSSEMWHNKKKSVSSYFWISRYGRGADTELHWKTSALRCRPARRYMQAHLPVSLCDVNGRFLPLTSRQKLKWLMLETWRVVKSRFRSCSSNWTLILLQGTWNYEQPPTQPIEHLLRLQPS